ncbi:trichohyalin isoform X1 [Drosophila sulfurigaster albostrigata]|uniref:trichohyalin isoform X1 n=1 Tax=Drosophila sulfurigaster albostrigata TaxID=89887 RepID=UPI002D21B6E9|nr:trichohyalin isoform X1 [Drosophila sulfurigaster albostrigata]
MAADEALTGVGELLFSLLIGYLGALEFAFVAQHLYHWTCRHPNTQQGVDAAADAEELPRLRDRLDKELAEAAAREAAAGSNVMQDGVAYSNGFRVESPEDKRKALAAELERQRHIEEETRKQLAEAEAKLAEERQRQQLAAEAAEAAESERKLLEAEKQRAAEQREREENERKAREREEQERQENERKLLEAERQREENERRIQAEEEEKRQREIEESARQRREAEEQREREENERKLREAEEQRLEEERQRELQEAETLRQKELQEEAERQQKLQEEAQAEVERQLLQLDDEDEQARRDAEIVERLLAAERERKLSATESELEEEAIALEQSRRIAASKTDLERKQKSIEENARLFMEAEEEMVMLHQRMLQAAQEEEQSLYAGAVPVVEEPCIKKLVPPRFEEPEQECEEPLVVQRVKTQLGQGSGGEEPYMVKSKTLTFPGVSDEGSSVEPISSQQSSFSTQPSEERSRQQTEEERQEPEGEDNVPDVQYTEDYLRSLDGIKSRPLIREDGSGRRRAFKKRRSSGSSNSSRDSRASRDEELKMFTSLEEEELRHGDKADYNPIKYTTEPTLRVKSHHRRHKRSPAKDAKPPADVTSSLEMLGEESTNPWGEVMPEHYKDTEFWKREKALSIDEEELDLEKRASGEEVLDLPKNKPNASSFEEATDEQNELAANTLRQQHSKEQLDKESTESSKATEPSSSSSDIKSNLQTSSATEEQPRRSSPGLRRSPRIDEMDHYEERWRQSEQQATQPSSQPQTPSISVQQPDTAPWRDQYGLLMEGISDFYDFTASVNPSRSRSTSRNPSPQPKNVANRMDVDEQHTLEVYDDTADGLVAGELNCELVLQMLETTINGTEMKVEQLKLQNVADDVQNGCQHMVTMVYEDERSSQPRTVAELEQSIQQKDQVVDGTSMDLEEQVSEPQAEQQVEHQLSVVIPQPVIEINALVDEQMENSEPVPTREEMRLFVETMRAQRNSRSRSRSISPLPTSDNIARSLETRRQKRIRQNDELFEKLQQEELQRSNSTSPIPPEELPKAKSPSPSTSPLPVEPATPLAPFPVVPTISIEVMEDPDVEKEPEDTPESMARLFEQLRLNRCRSHSRSRSRSPLPSAANLEHSLQKRREKLIAQNDTFFAQLEERAKTPEPERRLVVEHRYEYVESTELEVKVEGRDMRSLSPSRSRSMSPPSEEDNSQQFHLMLNLEGSEARTLRQHSQELERLLNLETAEERQELEELLVMEDSEHSQELELLLKSNAKQREVDLEALQKFNTANEEMELRLMSPPKSEQSSDYERSFSEAARDLKDELHVSGFKRSTYVGESLDMGSEFEQLREEAAHFRRSRSPSPSMDLDVAREQAAAQRELQAAILNSLVTASGEDAENRLGAKPKTTEYERTFSEEVKDTQRMKEEALASGFKRSTYVGESIDLGITSQLDDLRHRTAEFNRSRSQSRSPVRDEMDAHALKNIEAEAAKRELQDQLLDQLVASSGNFQDFSRHLNADFLESERRASDSALIQLDPFAYLDPEEYHHFRRYSLAQEQPVEEYPSDECVYISQIEVRSLTGKRTWLKEDFYTQDLADLELSLTEEKEKRSEYLTEGSWARAVLAAEAEAAEFDETSAIYNYDIIGDYPVMDELSTNDSDDERQTVVEIDDDDEYEFELDEGISDNNERTQPTDESHHDTSECEEAERNADRYANRGADDWEEVEHVEDLPDYNIDDGAVGGAFSDPDFYIEQIYNDAVKNRKQSGILREYETMIQEQLTAENADQSESEKDKSSSDSERYALWAKTRELDRSEEHQRHHKEIDISIGLLESERRDTDMRYLGDAQGAARQSTRLRTRYGYSPKLQVDVVDDDIEVDLNYKPKREYNWRKNFKLDDNEPTETVEKTANDQEDDLEAKHSEEQHVDKEQVELLAEQQLTYEGGENLGESLDLRRISLGGESITLFSRSPEREKLADVPEEGQPELENGEVNGQHQQEDEQLPIEEPLNEKPKKKKSKKKSRKGSKTEEELRDDNDSDNQQYDRRSSATREDQECNTEAPKRKVRSRRSSKSSGNNEELNGALFSPRSSIGFVTEALEGIAEFDPPDENASKKKTKKRKKLSKEPKEQISVEQPEEEDIDRALAAALAEIAPVTVSVSANLTPASTQQNLLSSISVGHSLCLTPASSFEEPMPSTEVENNQETSAVAPARSVVDTFDILKDANFYPLF